MKNAVVFGSGLALFLGAASAQDYDETNVCGDERYGEFDDERVCKYFSLPLQNRPHGR